IIGVFVGFSCIPLKAELNPICHLLALLGGATIVVVSRLRVNVWPVGDRLFAAPLKSAPGARTPLAPPKGRPCLATKGHSVLVITRSLYMYFPYRCVISKSRNCTLFNTTRRILLH